MKTNSSGTKDGFYFNQSINVDVFWTHKLMHYLEELFSHGLDWDDCTWHTQIAEGSGL